MTAIKEWFKKYWGYVVAGVLAVVAFFIGRKLLQKQVVVQPGPSKKQVDEEKKAEELKEQAQEKRELEVKEADKEYKKVVETQTKHIEAITAEVQEDPDKTNDFLKSVGKNIRED